MKINEIEKVVGISKKNIRFYEEQGLLAPARNRDNGYREYGEKDIFVLQQIKFLRKLGVPLEEIRLLQSGKSTVADTMRRHLITLEREQQNLNHAVSFCSELKEEDITLSDFDVSPYLQKMESVEKEGASFKGFSISDVKPKRYVGATVMAFIMVILMAACIGFMLWAFKTDPKGAPPLPLFITLLAVPIAVIIGVLYSLVQRIMEINKGEIDDAKKF